MIMTQEQKAKAYDEAVQEAYITYKDEDKHLKATLEQIFPELKESEDERIRKWLITQIELKSDINNPRDLELMILKSIDWLEKQGEQTPVEIDDVNAKRMFIKALERVEEQNNKGYKLTDCDKNSWWEDFKTYISHTDEQKPINYENINIRQNDFASIDPKFHEGDWVVNDNGVTFQIATVNPGYYILNNGMEFSKSYVEKYWHLWTIQDAKDGDVLFQDLMDGKTFIYNGINPDMSILYSFIISNDGKDVLSYHIGKPNIGIGNIEENKNIIHPATKEQRDLLFSKMKEVGYEWDADKKELKIVATTEETPAWTEEDERMRKEITFALKFLETELKWDFIEDEEIDMSDVYDWLEKQSNKV